MRRRAVAVALLSLGMIGIGCTSDMTSTPAPSAAPHAPGSASRESGRAGIDPLVAPMRAAAPRWARGNLPRSVPDVDVSLPSLLGDPPGRAVVASYVPRPEVSFAGVAIEFYGVDGRWRRLSLGDLDLPDDGWGGGDTYGAGALSPDGRWWAGPMRGGMFLVDLRDGTSKAIRVGAAAGLASFDWSPDGDELVLIVSGRSWRVSVPGLKARPFPRPKAYPKLRADGSWVECPTGSRFVVAECTTFSPAGVAAEVRQLPNDLAVKSVGGSWDQVGDSGFFSLGGPYGNRRRDWELVRADLEFRADARLILPAGSEINGVQGPFDGNALQLVAIEKRLLLAWLVDGREIVKLLRPGARVMNGGGMDWWDVTFARDLVQIR